MQSETLLICSLIPEYFGKRAEDRNLIAIVEQYLSGFTHRYRLKVLLGSAHREALDRATKILSGYKIDFEVMLIPFEFAPELNERRAHEISFCKKQLALRVRALEYDILLQLDADVHIGFGDLDTLACALTSSRAFVNIPYVAHHRLAAPGIQLGVYMHRKSLLDQIDYTHAIYNTFKRGGRIFRRNAPDCAVRSCLLRRGAVEIRACPPKHNVETRHYSHNGTYGLYKAGRMSRHFDLSATLGFDPIRNSMAMEPASCEFLVNACRRLGARTAIEFGTGAGNSCRSLMAGGIQDIVSVDDRGEWTQRASELRGDFTGELTFLTCPLVSIRRDSVYDLSNLYRRRFDLVVIDGPAANARGRLAAALAIEAPHYVFHDSRRYKQTIASFVEAMSRRERQFDIAWHECDRGMALVTLRR